MNYKTLTQVALRYRAVFLDISRENINMQSEASAPVMAFTARLRENGFAVSEQLLHALNAVSVDRLAEITACVNEVMGVDLNWAPLVKGWNVPTGESVADHLVTLLANIFGEEAGFKGTTLPCGHLIPEGTFPLERYNGCPFCGRPFVTAGFVYKGQGSKLKELRLFTLDDMKQVFHSLLTSATPLDGTQKDSLSLLLRELPLPETVSVTMKETAMLVVKQLVEQGRDEEAGALLKTPTDVLRYLWYEKTGYVQIIEPKTLMLHADKLYYHMWGPLDMGAEALAEMKMKLMLKYDRKTCLRVAKWLNGLPVSAAQAAENMNPKRGMWVRMIRALRLGEYSRKSGFGRLAELLDVEGVAAIELNISCPNVKDGGIVFGTVPKAAAEVTGIAKQHTGKPVIVKLSPNVTDIVEMALAVEEAGADAISLINTLMGMAIDIEKRKPLLSIRTGGLSGPAVKPVALRMVWQVAKAVGIPVVGLGGISCAKDAIEFLMAGATAIEIGTANFLDPAVTIKVRDGINDWLDQHGCKDIHEIIGCLE